MGIWLRRILIYGPLVGVGIFLVGLIAGMLTLPETFALEQLLSTPDMATRNKVSSALVALRGGDRVLARSQLQALAGSPLLNTEEQAAIRSTLNQLEPGEKTYRPPLTGWKATVAGWWHAGMDATKDFRVSSVNSAVKAADWTAVRFQQGKKWIRGKIEEWRK